MQSEVAQNYESKVDQVSEKPEMTCLEESVIRMRHGIRKNVKKSSKVTVGYEKMSVSDSVYKKLLEIELRALEKTGRLEPMLKKSQKQTRNS